jgi:hypothetical protein
MSKIDSTFLRNQPLAPELSSGLLSQATQEEAPAITTAPPIDVPLRGDIRKSQGEKERIDNEFTRFLKEQVGIDLTGEEEPAPTPAAVTGADPYRMSLPEQEAQRRRLREQILSPLGPTAEERPFSAVNIFPELLQGVEGVQTLGSRLWGEIRRPLAAATGPFSEVLSRELPHSPHSLVRELGLEEPNAPAEAIRGVTEGAATILPFLLTKSPAGFAGLAGASQAGKEITEEAYGERGDAGSRVLRTMLSALSGYGIGKVGHSFLPKNIPTLPASAAIFASKAAGQGSIAYTHQVLNRAIELADSEKLDYESALKKAFVANFWKTVGEFGLFNLPGLVRNVRGNLKAKSIVGEQEEPGVSRPDEGQRQAATPPAIEPPNAGASGGREPKTPVPPVQPVTPAPVVTPEAPGKPTQRAIAVRLKETSRKRAS